MSIYKWLIPVTYFLFWAYELIPVQKPPLITDLISSYVGYHALVLHFTIYLILELLIQYRVRQGYDILSIIRKNRFVYGIKEVLNCFIYACGYVVLFYFIFGIIYIYRYGYESFLSNQLLITFGLYVFLISLYDFIFNLIQKIIHLITNHGLVSVLIAFMISVSLYYMFPQILPFLELAEQLYITGFHYIEYMKIILVFISISFIFSCSYIYLFMKKDIIYAE